MTKTQYNRIKKLINKLEDEALNEGVDITLPNFQTFVDEVLKNKNISTDEYLEHDEPKPVEDKPEEIELKIV